MKINFGELLASERVRPLWGRSHTPESALDELQRLLLLASGQGGQAASSSVPADAERAAGLLTDAPGDRGSEGAAARGVGVDPGRASPGAAPLAAGAVGGLGGSGGSGVAGYAAAAAARAADGMPEGAPAAPAVVDLADVPIRPPHQIFDELEQNLRQELGSRSAMVGNFIEALRVRIHKLDPTAPEAPYHPLRHAAGGTIWELLGRLEDTLSGLRRVAGKR